MKLSDIQVGMTVYHSNRLTWGKGIVVKRSQPDGFAILFGGKRPRGGVWDVVVKFEAHDDNTTVKPSWLRTTPNKRRMREMIKFFTGRGQKAYERDGRLILEDAIPTEAIHEHP